MEAEIRQTLADVTREDLSTNPFVRLLARAQEVGGVELELPPPEFVFHVDVNDESSPR